MKLSLAATGMMAGLILLSDMRAVSMAAALNQSHPAQRMDLHQLSIEEIVELVRIETQLQIQEKALELTNSRLSLAPNPTSHLTVIPHLFAVGYYDVAYGQISDLQQESLAHTFMPEYYESIAMQSALFQALGETFNYWTDGITCTLPDGQGNATYTTTDLTTGPVSNFVLLPLSFPQINFSTYPAWFSQLCGPYNTNPIPAYFYSATFNGNIHHSGLAAVSVKNGVQVVSILPDTVDGQGLLIPAYLVPQLRWLHYAGGGLSFSDLFLALTPAYLPPVWVAHADDARAIEPLQDCTDVGLRVEEALAEFNKCLEEAEARYLERIRLAGVALQNGLDSLGPEFWALRAIIHFGGGGILSVLTPQQQIDYESKCQYLQGFLSTYDQAIKDANTGLGNDRCACIIALHNKLRDLLENCEPWNLLLPELDVWRFQFCPFPIPG